MAISAMHTVCSLTGSFTRPGREPTVSWPWCGDKGVRYPYEGKMSDEAACPFPALPGTVLLFLGGSLAPIYVIEVTVAKQVS